ncbi:hypothetical protein GRI62_11385 [Erythrobacter arachoides]|uniref:MAPEG family protein n=1 Tax=Aurantiacibacter arachoides TaxID=1850444 RepID=A0A845A5I7_9SPHN|nr:MAPEG family protein [Aurantiacibacter arachoides]MXO94197.1 hypothetical protein [Aurantiacibacter arachoides]
MPVELKILALGAVLLLVHIQVAIRAKTRQYGVTWNTGARDEALPPLGEIPARLERARDNFQETLPIAIIALLGLVVAGKTSEITAVAGWVWLGARVVYLPLYWTGVKLWRTVVFGVSALALIVLVGVLLFG